jgi:hypothetical protein
MHQRDKAFATNIPACIPRLILLLISLLSIFPSALLRIPIRPIVIQFLPSVAINHAFRKAGRKKRLELINHKPLPKLAFRHKILCILEPFPALWLTVLPARS